MPLFFNPFKPKTSFDIDPALRTQLEKRGMTDKLRELELAVNPDKNDIIGRICDGEGH